MLSDTLAIHCPFCQSDKFLSCTTHRLNDSVWNTFRIGEEATDLNWVIGETKNELLSMAWTRTSPFSSPERTVNLSFSITSFANVKAQFWLKMVSFLRSESVSERTPPVLCKIARPCRLGQVDHKCSDDARHSLTTSLLLPTVKLSVLTVLKYSPEGSVPFDRMQLLSIA